MLEFGSGDIALLNLSAKGAGTFNSDDQHTPYARGVTVYIALSVTSGTVSVVPKIQGKDVVSGNYYDILAGAAMTATGVIRLSVYPAIAAAANVSISEALPSTWRVSLVSGAGASPLWNATAGASILM